MGMKMVQDVKPGGVFMINCQWTDAELDEHLNAADKKYIADNNIQLYTINAIDKAIEIGMGKRTNTILQSAFFKLADVMPIDDAVEYMKAAAKKSYGKKGDAVVQMNWKLSTLVWTLSTRSRCLRAGTTPLLIPPRRPEGTRGSGQADP